MISSASQLKGKIKNLSGGDAKRSESLVRLFFMERFLERISVSEYRDRFILKGGLLAASLLGVELRTTMDIDASVKALSLEANLMRECTDTLCKIDISDNISFEISDMETIMDDFDYPGIRIHLLGRLEGIRQPIKIDFSTDDIITPKAIEYDYKLMFEERTIKLLSYNTETLLAEKMQTILSRSIANTRLRDYYDVYMIISNVEFDWFVLSSAFGATCEKRGTKYSEDEAERELKLIGSDTKISENWNRFKEKNSFAKDVDWNEVYVKVSEAIRRTIG